MLLIGLLEYCMPKTTNIIYQRIGLRMGSQKTEFGGDGLCRLEIGGVCHPLVWRSSPWVTLPNLLSVGQTVQLVQASVRRSIEKWTIRVHQQCTCTMKQRSERRKHCALAVVKAEPKKKSPAADPLPGGAGRPKFNQPTDPVWWRSMHSVSSYRGNRHRPPVANTRVTDRITVGLHCAAKLSAQCNNVTGSCYWAMCTTCVQYLHSNL